MKGGYLNPPANEQAVSILGKTVRGLYNMANNQNVACACEMRSWCFVMSLIYLSSDNVEIQNQRNMYDLSLTNKSDWLNEKSILKRFIRKLCWWRWLSYQTKAGGIETLVEGPERDKSEQHFKNYLSMKSRKEIWRNHFVDGPTQPRDCNQSVGSANWDVNECCIERRKSRETI